MIVTIPPISVTTPDLSGLLARTPLRPARGSHQAPGRTEIAGVAVTVALIVVMAVITGAWTAAVARTPWRPVKGMHHRPPGPPTPAPAPAAQPASLDAARARLRPVTVITSHEGITAEIAACAACREEAPSS